VACGRHWEAVAVEALLMEASHYDSSLHWMESVSSPLGDWVMTAWWASALVAVVAAGRRLHVVAAAAAAAAVVVMTAAVADSVEPPACRSRPRDSYWSEAAEQNTPHYSFAVTTTILREKELKTTDNKSLPLTRGTTYHLWISRFTLLLIFYLSRPLPELH